MSPVSRGRKGKQNKRSIRRAALPELFTEPGECDCPACSDADFDWLGLDHATDFDPDQFDADAGGTQALSQLAAQMA